jgi:type II secretory pathway pseudopilin PulG
LAPLSPASQPFATEDAQWFQRIRANPNLPELNQFLWRFPASPFAPEARQLVHSLQAHQAFPQQSAPQFGVPPTPGIPPQQFPGAGYPPPPSSSGHVGAIIGVLVVLLLAAGVLAYFLWPSPTAVVSNNTQTQQNQNRTPTQNQQQQQQQQQNQNPEVRIGRLILQIDAECTKRRSEQGSFAVFASCATNKIAEDSYRRQPNATVNQCVTLCSQDARCNAFDFEANECFFYEEVTAVSNISGTAGIKK